jgi:hypothetical protein
VAKAFSGLGATICDATADLPSSPIEGLIVFQKDTNELKIYDGSVWVSVLDTDSPPGIVKITGASFSAVSSTPGVFVDNCFTSEFNNYRIMITISAASTNGTYGILKMRTGGVSGVNYDSAVYNHAHGGTRGNSTTFNTGVVNNTFFQYVTNQDDNYNPTCVPIDIFSPYLSEGTALTAIAAVNESTQYDQMAYAGWIDNTQSFTGFNFYASSGTITGRYAVYGYR